MLKNRDIDTMNPYLARTFAWMASNSAPDVASSAVPSTGSEPAFARPRESEGWMVILGLLRRRLYLPDFDDVQNPTRPPSSGTIQVGVETPAPVLRKVVEAMYFSSAMAMC